MKRALSLILVLATVFSAMLGVVSGAATEETKKLDISLANLQFADAVYPLFAVDYTAVYTGDKAEASALAAIKLEVYRNGELIETLRPATENLGNPAGTIAFKHEMIGLKNMGDIYTYRAVNGTAANYSDEVEYSILEYALESSMLGDDKLTNVVEKMIAVGAAAQTAFNYTDYDYDLAKKYSVTKLAGGATFADGTTKKIFTEGDTATYVASHKLTAEKVVWYNTRFKLQSTASSYTASYGESQTLFAVPAAQAVDMGDSYATKGSQIGYKTVGTSIASIVGDFANNGNSDAESKFTMTFTLATNSATGVQIHLRNEEYRSVGSTGNITESSSTDNRQKANVNIFRGFPTGGYLGPRYSYKGVCVNNDNPACTNVAPLSTAASGTVGEYITYSIVFDLSGQADCPACTKATGCTNCNTDGVSDGKTYTMAFYVNGVLKLTTILPIFLSYDLEAEDGTVTTKRFFDENLYLYFNPNPHDNLYIKHFAITAGDINDYK